ncbi:limbic system-associated membrane protein-like isoform X2 [Liolophura sinensis]|uniref:limbic system-associated membrane protein-like isoform X2 n=1 Tax=Liolophura sinensis TaxID=3198878 RepID=UPI0031587F9E
MLVFGNKLEVVIFPVLVLFIFPLLSYGEESLQPSFLTNGSTVNVAQKEKVVFPCMVANKGSLAVMWERKNGPKLFVNRQSIVEDKRYSLLPGPGFNLSISDVTLEDEDEYVCLINTSPVLMEQVTKLNVYIPPTIVRNSPERIEADLNQNITLNCSASGRPKPTITWTKEGGQLPTGDASFRGETLKLINLQRKHNGVYKCTASNSLSEPVSATINLNIEYKAMVFNNKHTVVHTGRQHSAKLPCMYDGNPRAEARWYKGAKEAVGPEIRNRGVRKPPAQNGEVSELVIHNPTDEDLGNYTCVVNNSLGTVNASFFVTGLPQRPMIISDSHGQYSRVYYMRWNVVSYDEPLVYQMAIRLANRSDAVWRTVNVSVDKKLDHTEIPSMYSHLHILEELSPDTPYEAKVKAKNFFGWSDFSDPFIFETREDGHTPPPPTKAGPVTKILHYGTKGPSGLSPDDLDAGEMNGASVVIQGCWASLMSLLIGLFSCSHLLH